MTEIGSGIKDPVDVVTALRRAAERPRTAQGWVHAGPALLEEAADQLAKAQHPHPALSKEQRDRLRTDFFAVIDGRIRERQREIEPAEPARLTVADVHAAIDALLRDLATEGERP